MAILQQSTAYTRLFCMVLTSDHVTGATGTSPIVAMSKAGAILTTAGGTVAEVTGGLGWYKIALTTGDTGTLGDLAFHITATSCDPTDFVDQISANSGSAFPANFSLMSIDSSGNVSTTSNIKKNTAVAAFMFVMTDATTHAPLAGLTPVAQRSLDGAAFALCANTVAEVGLGVYKIDLAATDTNANKVMLRFSESGADDRLIEIITQP